MTRHDAERARTFRAGDRALLGPGEERQLEIAGLWAPSWQTSLRPRAGGATSRTRAYAADYSISFGETPTQLAGSPTFTTLTAGGADACGLTSDGRAYCWGSNMAGQLGGGGGTTASTVPAAVAGGWTLVSISRGMRAGKARARQLAGPFTLHHQLPARMPPRRFRVVYRDDVCVRGSSAWFTYVIANGPMPCTWTTVLRSATAK